MKQLLRYLQPYMLLLTLSILCAAVSVAATLVLPILVGEAIDCMADAASKAAQMTAAASPSAIDAIRIAADTGLTAVLRNMLLWIAVGFAAQYVMGRLNTRVQTTVVRRLRDEAFDSVSRLPLRTIDSVSHGDLISRIVTDADAVGDGLLLGFSQLFTGVLTIVGTILFLFRISARIAPVVVLLTPLSLFVARFISGRTRRFFADQAGLRGTLTDYCDECVGGQKLLRAFGAQERAKARFDPLNEALNASSLKATFYSSLPNPSSRFVNNIIYMAVGILGALYCIAGGISVGGLTSFLSYASGYAKPFNEITGVLTELSNAYVCAGRLFELIGMLPERETGGEVLRQARGDVRFTDVAFSYDKETPLLQELSIHVRHGDHVAIVGPTGAGKTTLVNLLMRFYDTDAGAITVDGQDIAAMTRESLRGQFGMVLQDTWLREGTILENLTLGKEDASIADVIAAAELTQAHDFIRKLPENYYTRLSADGGVLSQGQKQLLCITRVMLSLPPMLILDEATSSIDTRTEMKIQAAFHRMMQNRTTFIVAHRLSTIRHSDLILYMENGQVLERGTHEELLTINGRYARLYRINTA